MSDIGYRCFCQEYTKQAVSIKNCENENIFKVNYCGLHIKAQQKSRKLLNPCVLQQLLAYKYSYNCQYHYSRSFREISKEKSLKNRLYEHFPNILYVPLWIKISHFWANASFFRVVCSVTFVYIWYPFMQNWKKSLKLDSENKMQNWKGDINDKRFFIELINICEAS